MWVREPFQSAPPAELSSAAVGRRETVEGGASISAVKSSGFQGATRAVSPYAWRSVDTRVSRSESARVANALTPTATLGDRAISAYPANPRSLNASGLSE